MSELSSLCLHSYFSDLFVSEDIFSSRTAVDTMFHGPQKTRNQSVDTLLVGFENGTLHLSIFDSFVIGTFDLSRFFARPRPCTVLLHSSFPTFSTQSLLLSVGGRDSSIGALELWYNSVDLRFISNSGDYLPLLAAKSTQLQNLLRYIVQTQILMQHEWKASQDLPSRFIRNIDETLEDQYHCNFEQATYHLVVTGNCYPPMKEWLTEELMERVITKPITS
jgi:anaphase-promoting complex subunit 4